MTRPYATLPEIEGRRRMYDRCETCVHHRIISGLPPCSEVIDLDVCQAYSRELLFPISKGLCPRFAPKD
jgi:hypothetical protein